MYDLGLGLTLPQAGVMVRVSVAATRQPSNGPPKAEGLRRNPLTGNLSPNPNPKPSPN